MASPGVQPPKRLGKPSGWGKALWKTSNVLMRSVRTGFEPSRHFVCAVCFDMNGNFLQNKNTHESVVTLTRKN